LAVRNVRRNWGRTSLTIVAVAIAVLAFVTLRTVLWSWTAAQEQASSDRLVSRHKVSFIMQMPVRYVEEIKQVPGVAYASYMNWFGAKHPTRDSEFFATLAVNADPDFFHVYDELEVADDRKQAWYEDRQGAIVADLLADKFGWKVGDRVTLRGTIYPGNWDFNISGIYKAKRPSVDRNTVFFHWKYLNESLRPRQKDQVGWIVSRISDSSRVAEISKAVDQRFDISDIQTLTMNERAFQASMMGMLSAILNAIDLISYGILAIMMLILGNTIAMGVRERTREYGTLRAIGFQPKHLMGFVLGEAVTLGFAGGLAGVLLSYPVVQGALGGFLEQNFGAFFPFFRVQIGLVVLALIASIILAVIAAFVPARSVAKLNVIDALRQVA
jgi:putative ABC transport system permease protein